VKNFILTGNPGVGKSSLLKECVYPLLQDLGGFITEEIRENNQRKGFLLKVLQGGEGVLAAKGLKSHHKLNKYGVDLSVLENMGLPAVQAALESKKVVVVDEIGSMEMMSEAFCQTIAQVLLHPKPLLATIRRNAQPFTAQIKKMSDTILVTLDRDNRVEIKTRLRAWLEEKVYRG